MSSLLPTFLLLLSSLASRAYGFANPGACTGACQVHDPALIQRVSDGTYFRFSTGNEIEVASSPSISGPWTNKGSVLPGGSKINLAGNTDLWAPDVHLVGPIYYLYYAVSTFGSQNSAIGLATSETLDVGSWTDKGQVIASSTGALYNAIDANFFSISSSNNVLNFGSFWDDIYQVPLASSLETTTGTPHNIAFNATGTHAQEGSFMFWRSPFYYLFFSAGICCGYTTSLPAPGEEYKIMVCRSSTATGGFVDETGRACASGGGTIVLASHGTTYGPGGQGVFNDPTLGPVLYYHYINTEIGFADDQTQFGWNQITWVNDWPTV